MINNNNTTINEEHWLVYLDFNNLLLIKFGNILDPFILKYNIYIIK